MDATDGVHLLIGRRGLLGLGRSRSSFLDDGKIQQRVQESVWNHEAYKWRTSRELYYEHYALVVSLIGRLTGYG